MIKNIIVGLILIGIGVLIYPYMLQVTDALTDMAGTLLPDMPATSEFFFNLIPMLLLYGLLAGAIWKIINGGRSGR